MRRSKYKAELEGNNVIMSGRHHTQAFSVTELPKWIAFYREMDSKHSGRTQMYKHQLDALLDLERKLVARVDAA